MTIVLRTGIVLNTIIIYIQLKVRNTSVIDQHACSSRLPESFIAVLDFHHVSLSKEKIAPCLLGSDIQQPPVHLHVALHTQLAHSTDRFLAYTPVTRSGFGIGVLADDGAPLLPICI